MIASPDFIAWAQGFWPGFFRFSPETGVTAGYAPSFEALPRHDDATRVAWADFLTRAKAELDTTVTATADEAMDKRLIQGLLALEIDALTDDDRYKDPTLFNPFRALEYLLTQPASKTPAVMVAMLDASVRLLGEGLVFMSSPKTNPIRRFLTDLIAELEASLSNASTYATHEAFVNALPNAAVRQAKVGALIAAGTAFLDRLRALEPTATADFAVGEARFGLILKHQHHIDLTPADLFAFGKRFAAKVKAELLATASRIDPTATPLEIFERLKKDHPARADIIAVSTQMGVEARQFLIDRDLLSLPKVERLIVEETPPHKKAQAPIAAIDTPNPADPDQVSHYYITLSDDPDILGEFCWPALISLFSHEAYPGHHLQFARANQAAGSRSFARLSTASSVNFEGWALYCEQMMLDVGWRPSPERQLIILRDRLWRAIRIVVDTGLQCGWMTFDEAKQLMMTELGMPEEQVLGDLSWYIQSPGVPMGYAFGFALLMATRDAVQAQEGSSFSLKSFHDRFLDTGTSALPLSLERAFGPAAVQAAVDHMKTI
jgi:uncharacterized protein (DUF885 family)